MLYVLYWCLAVGLSSKQFVGFLDYFDLVSVQLNSSLAFDFFVDVNSVDWHSFLLKHIACSYYHLNLDSYCYEVFLHNMVSVF